MRRPVPLTTGEKLKIVGLAAAVLVAAAVGVWAYFGRDTQEERVGAFFGALGAGRAEEAFEMLTPALQAELGSAAVLGARWREAGLGELDVAIGCAGLGGRRATVGARPRRVARSQPGSGRVRLGDVAERCRCRPECSIALVLEDDRIAGVDATF